MNSVQLAQRLARNLNVTDEFNLEAEVQLDVLSAINAGLQAFYREMPGQYKRTTLSHTLRAPRTLSVTYGAKYSNLVADDTFTVGDLGCTLRHDNGAADTVVIAANAVLDDYLLDSLTTGATLYSDVLPIQDVIERIIGAVRVYDATRAEPTALIRDERLRGGRSRRWIGGFTPDEIWYPSDSSYLEQVGRPRYYYLDPVGESQGFEPEFLLRVAPLPDKDYTVRMEAELSTQRIVAADLTKARTILVADAYIDDILIPICEAELTCSRYWADPATKDAILRKRDIAVATKIPKIPKDIAPTVNSVGRPWGF